MVDPNTGVPLDGRDENDSPVPIPHGGGLRRLNYCVYCGHNLIWPRGAVWGVPVGQLWCPHCLTWRPRDTLPENAREET